MSACRYAVRFTTIRGEGAPRVNGAQSMTDQEITDQLAEDFGGYEIQIPAPRSGKHWELYQAEVYGYHGCLDAPIGD